MASIDGWHSTRQPSSSVVTSAPVVYAETVRRIHQRCNRTRVELLIPGFNDTAAQLDSATPVTVAQRSPISATDSATRRGSSRSAVFPALKDVGASGFLTYRV